MAILNLFDYEKAAAEAIPAAYYEYFAGGVADNITRNANRTAFDNLRLRPRVMRDVSQLSLETSVQGNKDIDHEL